MQNYLTCYMCSDYIQDETISIRVADKLKKGLKLK